MQYSRILAIAFTILAVSAVGAHAAGDPARGKALFNDKNFAGGSKACNDCHQNGNGMDKAAAKKEFKIMGKTAKSLEDAVNICIVNANKGKAIDVKSQQMQDIIAYIMSFKKKQAPGY